MTVLLLLFQFGFLLFLSLLCLLWLGIPKYCWFKVVRVGMPVLSLNYKEMLLAFQYCV